MVFSIYLYADDLQCYFGVDRDVLQDIAIDKIKSLIFDLKLSAIDVYQFFKA